MTWLGAVLNHPYADRDNRNEANRLLHELEPHLDASRFSHSLDEGRSLTIESILQAEVVI